MLALIYAENLKYKRSLDKKLSLLAPGFFIIFALYIAARLPEGMAMIREELSYIMFNWWPVIFIPLGTALLGGLSYKREKRAGNGRNMLLYHKPVNLLWYSKIIAVALQTLRANSMVILCTGLFSILGGGGIRGILQCIVAGFLLWCTSLSIIPLQLFVAFWKGTLCSMIVGIVGMMTGVLMAPESWWFFNPYSIATRIMSPIIGVHPNGVILPAQDSLRDPSVIWIGILLSFLYFIVFSFLSGMWFLKREVK
jgi:lantibiotic transport system permease protein